MFGTPGCGVVEYELAAVLGWSVSCAGTQGGAGRRRTRSDLHWRIGEQVRGAS
ncbi:hypothetical protein [Sciscionella marina]|uniref:hypothetical protein n=1 Tax=Sciscionella marina TaxID=508770 RepID=UPI0012F6EE0D|nr:hypothetical protein [Sciscionella marina]